MDGKKAAVAKGDYYNFWGHKRNVVLLFVSPANEVFQKLYEFVIHLAEEVEKEGYCL